MGKECTNVCTNVCIGPAANLKLTTVLALVQSYTAFDCSSFLTRCSENNIHQNSIWQLQDCKMLVKFVTKHDVGSGMNTDLLLLFVRSPVFPAH